MADFTTFNLQVNTGTNASPTYTALGAAGTEIRWSDVSTVGGGVASAAWPPVIRPAAGTAQLSYTYAYTADAVGLGFIGNGTAVPAAYAVSNYLWARWNWDNLGTFASAPIFTAYNTNAHAAPTVRATPAGGLLEGHGTDTTSRSYLKGNAFGRVSSAGAPTTAPPAPAVTDGSNGSVSPTVGANWITSINSQGLMADVDNILAPFTPVATTADTWHVHFSLFDGVNMTPGTLVPVMSIKYTYS